MENNIPLNTIIHMLTIKLGSSNYLSWKNQIIPILSYQNLLNHVDGTGITPPSTRREADKTVDNPDYSAWVLADQKTRPLMVTLPLKGFTPSVIKFNSFKKELNLLSNMAGYSKPFVISLPLLDIRWMKVTNCSGFFAVYVLILKPSTLIRSARPAPSFAYLLSRTESHEMFYQALHRSFSPIVAFTATHQPPPSAGRGHGGSYRPLLHIPVIDDDLAKAFVSQCHVGSIAPNWYVDSGATDYMTTTTDNITNVTPASRFRCLDPVTSRIYVSRHAQFDETFFPFSSSTPAKPSLDLPVITFSDFPTHQSPSTRTSPCTLCMDSPPNPPPNTQAVTPQPSSPTVSTSNTTTPQPSVLALNTTTPQPFVSTPNTTTPISSPPLLPHVPQQSLVSAPTSSSHPMITYAKAGIFKPRHLAYLSQLNHLPLNSALYATTDPTSFKTTKRDPKWVKAKKQELDALHKNNMWSLVPRPTNRLETASPPIHDVVTTHLVTASKHFMMASARTDSHADLEDSTYDGVTTKMLRRHVTVLSGSREWVMNILKSNEIGPFQMGTFGKTLAEEIKNRGQGNNARGGGAAGYGGAHNRVWNANPCQARQIKCYNYNGIGYIARNCTQPKRPQNSEYFKDKMLLMQAQENGVALDEEQLLFIAGGQDNAIDEDVDEQPVQDLALNVDNVFQADDCDAFDSDVDEAPTAQTMFMANLSSADPVYDEVGPSYDSDILSEVHDHDHYQDAVCEHHEEHEMHDDVQPNYVVDSHADYTSDSNMIPYDQYVKDNAVPVVQSNVSSVPNDAYMMIYNDMYEPHAQSVSKTTRNTVVDNSLTAELATYKEQVELYERRARFELTEREQKIDEQLRIVITDRNIKEENLKKELHSVKLQLASTINHNKSMVEEVTSLKKDFKQKENKYLEEFLDMKALKEKVEDKLYKQDQSLQTVHMLCKPKPYYDELNKVAIGYKNPLCLTRAKQVQPAIYNGYEIIKNNHVSALVHKTEDTLETAEITRTTISKLE
ncbi:retrovirus-related pol polyprotein from transposon TNT 1-94 [Tanacetum coccineum]